MAWSNILGHDHWIEAFRAVHRRGRMAHAYLFVGPDGIGKKLFARELAKALLCENPPAEPNLTACDTCSACLLVDANTHPDFFLVAKEDEKNELPIGTMRDVCDSFGLKPARGHGKVGIVDDADYFNEAAANCFLKTLEEPPPRSTLILLGTSTELQLPTIRSRCQLIRFAPLPSALVQKILEKEDLPDRALLPRLVRLAAGSPGRARLLADPELWVFRGRILAALTQAKFPSVEMSREFVKFVEEAGKEPALHRARATLTLTLILAAVRDAVRIRLGEPAPEDEAKTLQSLAQRADPEKWLAVVDRTLQAEIQFDRYVQVGLVLEGLLDAWAQILDRR